MKVYVVAAYIGGAGAPHPLAVCTTADMAIRTLQEMCRLHVELDPVALPAERLAALRASLDRDGAAQTDDELASYVRVERVAVKGAALNQSVSEITMSGGTCVFNPTWG